MHYSLSEALSLFDRGETDAGVCALIQLQKSVHQCALDGGDWSSAVLLLTHEDPLSRSQFGGSQTELQEVLAYRKALQDLKKGAKDLGRAAPGSEALNVEDDVGDSAAAAPSRPAGGGKYTAKQWRAWKKKSGGADAAE